jgi:type IV pilus assembly protein PilV
MVDQLEHQWRHRPLRRRHDDGFRPFEGGGLLMKRHPRSRGAAPERGASMIEILITLVITAFGLLGLATFATKATALSVDATQRARAAALLNDMAARIGNNKANAAAYVTGAVQGAAVINNCGAVAVGPARDLCEWNNLLAGANDAQAGGNAGFLGYRGCVTQPDNLNPVFVVTVAWGSLTPGIPSADLCAEGVFGDDAQRRTIRSQVRVATLAL